MGCITDLRDIDTTPGADCLFAPPAGFDGDDEAYGRWLTSRYKESPEVAQQIYSLWRFERRWGQPPGYRGPFARRLAEAMERYHRLQTSEPRAQDGAAV